MTSILEKKHGAVVEKIGMTLFRKRLQQWDLQSNDSVNGFIANFFKCC